MAADAGITRHPLSIAFGLARLHSALGAIMDHPKQLVFLMALLPCIGLLTGCRSVRPTAGERSNVNIHVSIVPLEQQEGWFELRATLDEGSSGAMSTNPAQDHLVIPPLRACVGSEPAVLSIPGGGAGAGPQATFKVLKAGGLIMGEYRVGFVDEKRSIFSEGRTVLGPLKGQPGGAANRGQPVGSETNQTSAAAGSRL
jgi:hypothetical protein